MNGKDGHMPLGDLHGTSVDFRDRDGNAVGFEFVRVGTMREFETVKAAHKERGRILDNIAAQRDGLQAKLDAANEEYRKLHALFAAEDAERDNLQREVARLTELAYVQGGREGLTEREHREAIVQDFQKISREKNELRAELDNLMSVKASLEETNTALEVRDKELREATEQRDASNATLTELKEQLLVEGNRFKTILDVMAERL
jgi:chromosome segregation ATPase